jgi:RecA-family ATPase
MNTVFTIQTRSKVISFPVPCIPGLPAIDNVSQLIENNHIFKPNELVCGLIHQGTKAVLAGGSKVGKTWILLDLALSVATGSQFLHWPTSKGKVLYINLEIQRAFIKSRIETLMQRRQITQADNLNFWNLRGKTANFEALVANIIRETDGKGYAMIILDPIYKAMIGKSENTAGSVGELCNQLERLAERTGAAIVFAHHFTKGNAKKKAAIDRMSGSGVFARDADTIITLTEHSESNCYTVEMTLRNLAPQQPFVVQWDYPVMNEREDLDPEEMQEKKDEDLDTIGQTVLDVLKSQPMSNAEWLLKCMNKGVSRASFFRVKSLLKENNYISFDLQTKLWTASTGADTNETIETRETEASKTVTQNGPGLVAVAA